MAEEPSERAVEGVKHLLRFMAVANAGGVAATITVIGASAKNGSIHNILAVPLAFFGFGVFFVLLYALSLTSLATKQDGASPPSLFLSQWFMDVSGYGGLVLFFLGVVSGVVITGTAP